MSQRTKVISLGILFFLACASFWVFQEVAIAKMVNTELWKVSDMVDGAIKQTSTDCTSDLVVTVKVTPRLKGLYEDATVAIGQQVHEKGVQYSLKQNGDKTQVWATGIGKTEKEREQTKLLGEKYMPGSQYCLAQERR